jgi:hypothetical protein
MAAVGLGLDVASIAELILERTVDHFAAADVALPARQIIAPGSPGEIAWDCPMLAVTMSSIGVGASPGGAGSGALRAGPGISAMGLRYAVFSVTLTREEPPPTRNGAQPPSADVLRTAALGLMRDGGLLSQALVNVCTAVADGLPMGSLVQAGEVQTSGPSGGHVGVIGTLTTTVGQLV